MARYVKLPDTPPSIVFRRSDGKLLSPEWEGAALEQRMQRFVDLYGAQIIARAMEMAREENNVSLRSDAC